MKSVVKNVVMEAIDSMEIISICDLLERIFPGYWDNLNFQKYSYEETSEAVSKWCNDNDAHYYARPKEYFFKREAIEEAENLGKSKVVVEDLS